MKSKEVQENFNSVALTHVFFTGSVEENCQIFQSNQEKTEKYCDSFSVEKPDSIKII